MYVPNFFFGGSSLLHLLARHPRVVGFFGLAGTIAMLSNGPYGAQVVGGTTHYVQALDRAVTRTEPGMPPIAGASTSSEQDTLAIVTETLQACGQACGRLTPQEVMSDPALLHDVLIVHAADAGTPSVPPSQGRSGRAASASGQKRLP